MFKTHQWLFCARCKFLSWNSHSWLEEACGVEWDGNLGSREARDLKIQPSIIFIFGFFTGGKDKISQVACAKTLIWENNFPCASFTHNSFQFMLVYNLSIWIFIILCGLLSLPCVSSAAGIPQQTDGDPWPSRALFCQVHPIQR